MRNMFLADLKVKELRRSYTPILDYDAHIVLEPRTGVPQTVERLFRALWNKIASQRKPADHESETVLQMLPGIQQVHDNLEIASALNPLADRC